MPTRECLYKNIHGGCDHPSGNRTGQSCGCTPKKNTATDEDCENAKFICYQCCKRVAFLFSDSRCKKCTRLTKEEIIGESEPKMLDADEEGCSIEEV